MPTILLVSPYWKEAHRWMVSTVKLAELWQRLGYRVVVVCMGSATSVEHVSATLTIHRRKDFFLPDPWNYGIALGFSGYVRRMVKEVHPNLIIVNKLLFWSSLSTVLLRLTGHKVLVITDALVGMTWWPRDRIPKICAAIYAWTLGWLILLCASRIVFFHPQPPQLLRRLGIAKKTQVIPTGIDLSTFNIQHSTFNSDARDTVTVTYIGRLESVKGADDFVEALVPLKKEYPHLTIQVVGWYPSTLLQSSGQASSGQADHPLVQKFEREVIFTGLREDIPDILAKTDIFVMPSYSEGLSNAIMEAMASGCACVVTEVGGNVFLVQNGVSGFYFAPGDREALRAHVRRLMEDPAKRRNMGLAARERIEKEFSWDIVGEKYKKLFEELLASSF